ncbi:hypothetical protein [Candidatus Pristimantibacillus sp. PTI5]
MAARTTKKGRISAPLHAVIIEPASNENDKATDRTTLMMGIPGNFSNVPH